MIEIGTNSIERKKIIYISKAKPRECGLAALFKLLIMRLLRPPPSVARLAMTAFRQSLCVILILAFVGLDISQVYPVESSSHQDILAVRSLFQRSPDASSLDDINLLLSACSIGKYIFGDPQNNIRPLPIKYLEHTLRSELEDAVDGLNLGEASVENNIITVPYEKAEKRYDILITPSGNIPSSTRSYDDWVILDRYAIKVRLTESRDKNRDSPVVIARRAEGPTKQSPFEIASLTSFARNDMTATRASASGLPDGLTLAEQVTSGFENRVKKIFDDWAIEKKRQGISVKGITVISVGSAARREMARYSDADLIILYDKAENEMEFPGAINLIHQEPRFKKLVKELRDRIEKESESAGYRVDFAGKNTIFGNIDIMSADDFFATKLKVISMLAGDGELYGMFEKSVEINRSRESYKEKELCDMLLDLWDWGEDYKFVNEREDEPNIKRGKGGLRYILAVALTAQTLYGIKAGSSFNILQKLIDNPEFSNAEGYIQDLIDALRFYLFLRYEVHEMHWVDQHGVAMGVDILSKEARETVAKKYKKYFKNEQAVLNEYFEHRNKVLGAFKFFEERFVDTIVSKNTYKEDFNCARGKDVSSLDKQQSLAKSKNLLIRFALAWNSNDGSILREVYDYSKNKDYSWESWDILYALSRNEHTPLDVLNDLSTMTGIENGIIRARATELLNKINSRRDSASGQTQPPLSEEQLLSYIRTEIDRRCEELYKRSIAPTETHLIKGASAADDYFKNAVFNAVKQVSDAMEDADIAISLILDKVTITKTPDVITFELHEAYRLIFSKTRLCDLIKAKRAKIPIEEGQKRYLRGVGAVIRKMKHLEKDKQLRLIRDNMERWVIGRDLEAYQRLEDADEARRNVARFLDSIYNVMLKERPAIRNDDDLILYLRRRFGARKFIIGGGKGTRFSPEGIIVKQMFKPDGYNTEIKLARMASSFGVLDDVVIVDAITIFNILKDKYPITDEMKENMLKSLDRVFANLVERNIIDGEEARRIVYATDGIIREFLTWTSYPDNVRDLAMIMDKVYKLISRKIKGRAVLGAFLADKAAYAIFKALMINEKDIIDEAKKGEILGENCIIVLDSGDGHGSAYAEALEELADKGILDDARYSLIVYADSPGWGLDTYPNAYFTTYLKALDLVAPGARDLPRATMAVKSPKDGRSEGRARVFVADVPGYGNIPIALKEWGGMTHDEQEESRRMAEERSPDWFTNANVFVYDAQWAYEKCAELYSAYHHRLEEKEKKRRPYEYWASDFLNMAAREYRKLVETNPAAQPLTRLVFVGAEAPDATKKLDQSLAFRDALNRMLIKKVKRWGVEVDAGTTIAISTKSVGPKSEREGVINFDWDRIIKDIFGDNSEDVEGLGNTRLRGSIHLDNTARVGKGATLDGRRSGISLTGDYVVERGATLVDVVQDVELLPPSEIRPPSLVPVASITITPTASTMAEGTLAARLVDKNVDLKRLGIIVDETTRVWLVKKDPKSDDEAVLKKIFGSKIPGGEKVIDQVHLYGEIVLDERCRIQNGTMLDGRAERVDILENSFVGRGFNLTGVTARNGTVFMPQKVVNIYAYQQPRLPADISVNNSFFDASIVEENARVEDSTIINSYISKATVRGSDILDEIVAEGEVVENRRFSQKNNNLSVLLEEPQNYIAGTYRLSELKEEDRREIKRYQRNIARQYYRKFIHDDVVRGRAEQDTAFFFSGRTAPVVNRFTIQQIRQYIISKIRQYTNREATMKEYEPCVGAIRESIKDIMDEVGKTPCANTPKGRALFRKAALVATRMNFVDFSIDPARFDIMHIVDSCKEGPEAFNHLLNETTHDKLAIDGLGEFEDMVFGPDKGTFIYLTDNIGEAEADALLWNFLARMGHTVVIAPKDDFSYGDIDKSGVEEIVNAYDSLRRLRGKGRIRITNTGSISEGIFPYQFSDRMLKYFEDESLIAVIAKGQANLFTLPTRNKLKAPFITMLLSKSISSERVTGISAEKPFWPIIAVVPKGTRILTPLGEGEFETRFKEFGKLDEELARQEPGQPGARASASGISVSSPGATLKQLENLLTKGNLSEPHKKIAQARLTAIEYVRSDDFKKSVEGVEGIELDIGTARNALVNVLSDAEGNGKENGMQNGKVVDLTNGENKNKKVILIGDLHGRADNLEMILRDINWEETKDEEKPVLLFLGDAVHIATQAIKDYESKTPKQQAKAESPMADSIRLIQRVFELKEGYPGNVYYLIGNHDNYHFFKTNKIISQNQVLLEALRMMDPEYLQVYKDFIDASPLFFVTEGLVAVHGGPLKGDVLSGINNLAGLKKLEMDLAKVDPKEEDGRIGEPLNAVTQATLGMSRLYIPRTDLVYTGIDIETFLHKIGLPLTTKFVVGHDHGFDSNEGKIEHNKRAETLTTRGTPPDGIDYKPMKEHDEVHAKLDFQNVENYVIFSGGNITGYGIFENNDMRFVKVPTPAACLKTLYENPENGPLTAEALVKTGNYSDVVAVQTGLDALCKCEVAEKDESSQRYRLADDIMTLSPDSIEEILDIPELRDDRLSQVPDKIEKIVKPRIAAIKHVGTNKNFGESLIQIALGNDEIRVVDNAIAKVKEDKDSERQTGKIVDIRNDAELKSREIILVSDLHGQKENLARMLADGLEERLKQGEIILVINGDAVHIATQAIKGYKDMSKEKKEEAESRMADSISLMQKIFEMKEKYEKYVYYLIGNHDNVYYFRTMKKMSQNQVLLSALRKLNPQYLDKYIEFLDLSPVMFIAGNLVVVHGGPVYGNALETMNGLKGLKEAGLSLRGVDAYALDESGKQNVITQIMLNMHRKHKGPDNAPLVYTKDDVTNFLRAIGMEGATFVVGHDHDFVSPDEDPKRTISKEDRGEYWARPFKALKNHYIIFSGGPIAGYGIFNIDTAKMRFARASASGKAPATRDVFGISEDELLNGLNQGFLVPHVARTTAINVRIGKALGLPEEQLRLLKYATLLHDVGGAARGKHEKEFFDLSEKIKAAVAGDRKISVKEAVDLLISREAGDEGLKAELQAMDTRYRLFRKGLAIILKRPLSVIEAEVAPAIFDVPTNTLRILGEKDIAISKDMEALLKYHNDYKAFLKDFKEHPEIETKLSISKKDMALLILTLYLADMFEHGNNRYTQCEQRKKERAEYFPETMEFVENNFNAIGIREPEDRKPLEALVKLLCDRDKVIIKTVLAAREAEGLSSEDNQFIENNKKVETLPFTSERGRTTKMAIVKFKPREVIPRLIFQPNIRSWGVKRDRTPPYFEYQLNGEPVQQEDDLPPDYEHMRKDVWTVGRHLDRFKQEHPELEIVGFVGNGNILANAYLTAYAEGNLHAIESEKDLIHNGESRKYPSLIMWKDGHFTIEEIAFTANERVIQVSTDKDVTEDVEFTNSGIGILKSGEPYNLAEHHEHDYDIRHYIDFPFMASRSCQFGFNQFYDMTTGKVIDNLIVRAINGEPITLKLEEAGRKLIPEEIEELETGWKGLQEKGYKPAASMDEVNVEGEYFIDRQNNTITIRFLRGINPHNICGIDKDGNLVSIVVAGRSGWRGITFVETQSRLKEMGINDAIVFDNGADVMMNVSGYYPIPSFTGRDRLLSILVFARPAVASKNVETSRDSAPRESASPRLARDFAGQASGKDFARKNEERAKEYEKMRVIPEKLDVGEMLETRTLFEFDGEWDWKRGNGLALLAGAPFTDELKENITEIQKALREIEPDPGRLYLQRPANLHTTVAQLIPNTVPELLPDTWEKYPIPGEQIEELAFKLPILRQQVPQVGSIKVIYYYKDLTLNPDGAIVALGFVENDNLDALRKILGSITPKTSGTVHMTIGRIFDEEISAEKWEKYRDLILVLRKKMDSNGKGAVLGTDEFDNLKLWYQLTPQSYDGIISLGGQRVQQDAPNEGESRASASGISVVSRQSLVAENAIGSLIVLARMAKREGQKLIIGLETDWIPGMNEEMSMHRRAIIPLYNEIKDVVEELRDMGLDNIELVHKKADELADALIKETKATETKLSNVVVLASKKTIESSGFDELRSSPGDKRAFLAGVNPELLEKSYREREHPSDQVDIVKEITLLLSITLELAGGKQRPRDPILLLYDENRRIAIFLPKAELINYNKLIEKYEAEAKIWQAA